MRQPWRARREASSSPAAKTIPRPSPTLRQMGFRQPSEVSATIRGWHFGRYAATRSARAKEILTEIMPAAAQGAGWHRRCRSRLHGFRSFSLGPVCRRADFLHAQGQIRSSSISWRACSALRHASPMSLGERPKVLDAVLDRQFFDRLPDPERARAADRGPRCRIPRASRISSITARIIGKEQMFRIGVRILSETVSAEDAGLSFSNLADVMIRPASLPSPPRDGGAPRQGAGRENRRHRHGQARRPRNDGRLRPRSDPDL